MSRVRRHARRHARRPPDLTSLFDVLFIVVFVALIRAAAAQQMVAELTPPPPKPAPPAPPAPAPPADVVALRAKALANLDRELADRTPLVVRIAAQSERDRVRVAVAALEVDGKTLALDVPLLSDSRDPDVEVAYLGERSADLRICRIAAVHLRAADLARHLVIIVPDRPYAELKRMAGSRALFAGLERDVTRCFIEQRGIAALIDPAELTRP